MKNYKKTREQKITELVAEGKNNAEIGKEVCLSPQAVANELTNIYAEHDVRNRMGLARKIWEKEK